MLLEERVGTGDKPGRLEYKWGKFEHVELYPDFFVYTLSDEIRALFQQSQDENLQKVVAQKTEAYITNLFRNELSASDYVKKEMDELMKRTAISEETYLRTADRYFWMVAMEKDFLRFIKKWDDIFQAMEERRRQEVPNIVADIYNQYGNAIDTEIENLTKKGQTSIRNIKGIFMS